MESFCLSLLGFPSVMMTPPSFITCDNSVYRFLRPHIDPAILQIIIKLLLCLDGKINLCHLQCCQRFGIDKLNF